MSQYVVIGTAPVMDTSVTVGPFRSLDRASEAWNELTHRGWVAETCELLPVTDVPDLDWSDER